jgi:hypothetical protein
VGIEIGIQTPPPPALPSVDLITAVLRQSMSWFLIHNHHSLLGNDNSNGRTALEDGRFFPVLAAFCQIRISAFFFICQPDKDSFFFN